MAKKSLSLYVVVYILVVLQPNVSNAAANATDDDINYGYKVPVTIVESAASTGAVCLDGTPPGYHFAEGFGEGKDNWLIYLLGGEWCHNVSDCSSRKTSHRGSSKYMNSTRFGGILHNVSTKNPDFYYWNRILVEYCDGASFTGDVENVDPSTGLHFRGKKVFDAVITDLLNKGMKDAKEVLLTGGSAGGLSVIIHCDRFSDLFPSTTKVKCLSDGGFFLHSKNPLQAQGLESMFREMVALHNSTGILPDACKRRMEDKAYMCMFPQYVVQDIKTPLLVMITAYDSYQINKTLTNFFYFVIKSHNISPSQYKVLQDFRLQVLDILSKTDKLSRGVFMNNCFTHTQLISQGWNNPKYGVNNNTDVEVIGEWYFGGRNHVQEIDQNNLVKDCDKDMYLKGS